MDKRIFKTFLLFILLDALPSVISGGWFCNNPSPPVCADDCDGNGYYISPDGTACIPCPQCSAGQELNKDCGNGLNGDAVCIPCLEGFFSLSTSQRCTQCTTCTNTVEQETCQLTQNRVCGDCLPGFFRGSDRFSTDFNACPNRCSDLPRDTPQCGDWWSTQDRESIEVEQPTEIADVRRLPEEVSLDGIDPCEPKTPLCIDPCHDGNFFLDYDGLCKACLSCQPGEELNKVCGRGKNGDAYCRRCPEGTFSEDGLERCSPCRICVNTLATECTASRNTVCGECLPGYYQDADGYFPDQGACPNKCPECPNTVSQCQEWCKSRTMSDQVTVDPAETHGQDAITPAAVAADIFQSVADNEVNDEAKLPPASHGSYMVIFTVLASVLAVVVIVLATFLFLFRCLWNRTDGSPDTPETPPLLGIADDLLVKLAEDIETSEQMEALGRVLGVKVAAINRYTDTNNIGGRVTCKGTRDMLFDWRQTVEPCNQHQRLKQALHDTGLVSLAETHFKGTRSIPVVYKPTTYLYSPEGGDWEFVNHRTAYPRLTSSRPISGGSTDVENESSAVSTPTFNLNRRLANKNLLRQTLERQVGHDDSFRSTPPQPNSVKGERMVNSASSMNHVGPFYGIETFPTQSAAVRQCDRDPRPIETFGVWEDRSRPSSSSGKVVTERASGTVHPHAEDTDEAPRTRVRRRSIMDENLLPLLNANCKRTAYPRLTGSRPVSGGSTDVEDDHDDSPRLTPPHPLKQPDSVKEERMVNSAGSMNQSVDARQYKRDIEDRSRPRAPSSGKVVTERASGTVHPHVEDTDEAPSTRVRRRSIISNNSLDEQFLPLLNNNRRSSLSDLVLGNNRQKLRNGRNGNTAPVHEDVAALFPTDSPSGEGPTADTPVDTNNTKSANPNQPSQSPEPNASSHKTPTAAAGNKPNGCKCTLVVSPKEIPVENSTHEKPAAIPDDQGSIGNKSPGDTNVTINITMTTKDVETVHIGDVHNKRNFRDGPYQGIRASEPNNNDDNGEAQKLLNVNMSASETDKVHVGDEGNTLTRGHVGSSDDDEYDDDHDGDEDKLLDPKSSLVFETQNNSNYVW